MIGEDGPDAHGPGVQCGLPAEVAEGGMAVYNVDLFTDDDVPEDREEGEDGRKACRAVDDEEGHVVDLEPVGEVADPLPIVVCVSNDHDLVTPVDEPLGQLVDVALDSSWLWEEEVADHGDIVRWLRHGDRDCPPSGHLTLSLNTGLRGYRVITGRP